MRILPVLLSGIFVVFHAACASPPAPVNANHHAQVKTSTISSETAIRIASGALSKNFDPANYDVSVKEVSDNLEVRFATKCKECLDGHPYVVINKTTGEVIRVFPYGESANR